MNQLDHPEPVAILKQARELGVEIFLRHYPTPEEYYTFHFCAEPMEKLTLELQNKVYANAHAMMDYLLIIGKVRK